MDKSTKEKIVVQGKTALNGKVRISGAKNAALALISASILAEGEVTLDNVPDINDVKVLLEIMQSLGVKVQWLGADSLKIVSPAHLTGYPSYELVKKLRASNLLLGPMLARYGEAQLSLPGGCNIGNRPMDLHYKGLQGLGAILELDKGDIQGRVPGKQLVGARIYLDFPSVGATENLMMAAALAKGQTTLENVAKEPEIVDLANFLNRLGCKVRGAGTDVIKIQGCEKLEGCSHYSVIPDRIEAGTFMVAAAATGGEVLIENIICTHVEPLSAKLREANAFIEEGGDYILVKADRPLQAIDIKTMPYPGFPTDLQSQVMAMLVTVNGTSVITENIFENRFQIVDELKRMGAKIKVESRSAIVEGVNNLQGTQVRATDLRAGAALVIAALKAQGTTEIFHPEYIYRGYDHLERKFRALGADITNQ